MSLIQSLVTDNPMLVEISRFRRRMFSGRDGGANRAVVVILLLLYALILFTVLRFAQDMEPVWIVEFQTGIFTLMLPVLASGAIAGERERRTWDILLTTPVTKAQIVAGKFIAIVAGYAIFLVACSLLVVACQIANRSAILSATLHSEGLSISFALMLISLSLLVSARSRTTFASIGASVAVVFVVYVAAPIFVLTAFTKSGGDFLEIVYPFATIGKLSDYNNPLWLHWRNLAPIGQDLAYLLLSAAMLAATVATVRRMEEIKDVMPEPAGKEGSTGA